MTLREELIQVAAVTVAWIEDIDLGFADSLTPSANGTGFHETGIFKEIAAERMAQDYKWGVQSHLGIDWMAILTEEIGESSREMTDGVPPEDFPSPSAYRMLVLLAAAEVEARVRLEEIGAS